MQPLNMSGRRNHLCPQMLENIVGTPKSVFVAPRGYASEEPNETASRLTIIVSMSAGNGFIVHRITNIPVPEGERLRMRTPQPAPASQLQSALCEGIKNYDRSFCTSHVWCARLCKRVMIRMMCALCCHTCLVALQQYSHASLCFLLSLESNTPRTAVPRI